MNDMQLQYGFFWGTNLLGAEFAILNGQYTNPSPYQFISNDKQIVLNKMEELGYTMDTVNTLRSIYFILPNGHSLANIRKVGSYALSTSIANTFFPGQSALYPGSHINTVIPLSSAPIGRAHAVIRHPVDRFVSGYTMRPGGIPQNLSVDDFISWLEVQDKGMLDWHFRPQTILVGSFDNIKYYDFAKGLDSVAADIGLPVPVDIINDTDPVNRPILTQEQINRLQDFYADDLALYASISKQ
jgi:hypothetical protein